MKFSYSKMKNYDEPYIIAELGANHNGDMELAKKMITAAKACGADCVKFQSWTKDSIFARQVYEENYFLNDDYRQRDDFSLEEIVDEFSISETELLQMKAFCEEVDIDFASTPFSEKEVDFLVNELKASFIKVASMDLTNIPFLEYIASKNLPVVLSTGMSYLSEVDEAIRALNNAGCEDIVLLHCVSLYPPEDEQVNLNNIDLLRDVYKYPTGFSDHTVGITAPIMAVAKGACLIEKHFTLDKTMFGWDHAISADEVELKAIVEGAKRGYKMLGSYDRIVSENANRKDAFRRSIVVTRNIKKGEKLRREDLEFKRPGTGIEPKDMPKIIGRVTARDMQFDEVLNYQDLV